MSIQVGKAVKWCVYQFRHRALIQVALEGLEPSHRFSGTWFTKPVCLYAFRVGYGHGSLAEDRFRSHRQVTILVPVHDMTGKYRFGSVQMSGKCSFDVGVGREW